MTDFSIYLHIPFCNHHCAYCDFNTYEGIESLIPEYVRALCLELEFLADRAGHQLFVQTIFFGGGTPSLLPANEIELIYRSIKDHFILAKDLEVTLEANPGTLSLSYLNELRMMGINRLSLGMQSANPGELKLLERQHDYIDVIQSVVWARQVGFDNLNLDLIFGLPYQSVADWQRSLKLAVDLQPEHFSLYALTLEHGTPMQYWLARGLISEPDPDLSAEMYSWASDYLTHKGYHQYEISNWSRIQSNGEIRTCRHNLQYWHDKPYLGFGAGAHGYADGIRVANVPLPDLYIMQLLQTEISNMDYESFLPFPQTPTSMSVRSIDKETKMGDMMMLGLRLTQEGVSRKEFKLRFGLSLSDVYGEKIDRLTSLGLLEWSGAKHGSLRLTPKGRLLGNQVFMEFV